jgi:mannose-6-phosphate isomerase
VLCKLLDAGMRLSIQAHPDRAFAQAHLHSNYGKAESWLVIDTRVINGEPPYILFGFRDGVTEEEFCRITRDQDTEKQVAALNRLPVQPGEVYLVPAGTPHAIGSGVFVVEVQEPTDYVVNAEYTLGTVRRTEAQCFMGLGFDLGMRCFNYQAVGLDFVRRHTLVPRILHKDTQGCEEILIGPEDTPCFGAARLGVRGAVPDRDRGRCYVGIVIEGQGQLIGPDIAMPLRAGATFFIPAVSLHEAYQATPAFPLTVIKCFPPIS